MTAARRALYHDKFCQSALNFRKSRRSKFYEGYQHMSVQRCRSARRTQVVLNGRELEEFIEIRRERIKVVQPRSRGSLLKYFP